MSWIKVNEELYQNDVSPFILQKINLDWFIVDLRDKSKAISFNDFFGNPVESLSLFLSNLDLTVKSLISIGSISGDSLLVTNTARAKHFRGDLSNDPLTPSFSSQGDADTGFYHISSGIFGFSSNGVNSGKFGNGYGGFTGNIIQVQSSIKTDTSTFGNTFGSISGLFASRFARELLYKFNRKVILQYAGLSLTISIIGL